MTGALFVKDLFLSYQGNQVVQNVSFSIENGKLIEIIGPNGVEKSTLMKAVLELIPNDKGYVKFLGRIFKTLECVLRMYLVSLQVNNNNLSFWQEL